ncbi:hypothetical protein HPB49_020645 [Dermacentor silvarum]|uniref:Uncharacterized protein n=1 Tax=Dermacentor silvarum TaxID=543639 RepID=A0ACB8E260_DERSI|nr:hypothetical protein HPB49_020645 [Dermacentor silvarum]
MLVTSLIVTAILTLLGFFYYYKDMDKGKFRHRYRYEPLASLTTYIAAFCLGIGPVPWVVMGVIISTGGHSLFTAVSTIFCFCEFLIIKEFRNLVRLFNLSTAAAAEPEATSRRTCLVCHKRFDSASKHRSHERRHRNKMLGRYRCTTCSKCFVQKSSLLTHVRIHTGERPYRCLHCDASFRDGSCYNQHKRVHSGERPYVCITCNKAFTKSGNLYRHMRSCKQGTNKSLSPS